MISSGILAANSDFSPRAPGGHFGGKVAQRRLKDGFQVQLAHVIRRYVALAAYETSNWVLKVRGEVD